MIFRRVSKISETSISLVMSRCMYKMEQLSSHWTDFHEI